MATANFGHVRTPNMSDKVYKDYCLYSFDTPLHDDGIYVCMRFFFAISKRFLPLYNEKTGATTFLHWRQRKFREEQPTNGATNGNGTNGEAAKAPTRMAIGVEGGFDGDAQIKTEDHYEIVVFPEMKSFSLESVPQEVRQSAEGIISAAAARTVDESATSMWDGEVREISCHSFDLQQLPTDGKTIPPSGWKCERCDLTKNLWLNLTDGTILCGRRFADGSGGNNHALEHYEVVRYPLAVKLGTITPKGGDVYSYAEDDMVLDPNLEQHLAHWGIDINKIEKSDKTMAEMEIEMNSRLWEYRLLEQSDKPLQPVSGPGLTPMVNLGNTCYFNSVLQMLFNIDDFVNVFASRYEEISKVEAPGDAVRDLRFQMAKLGSALLSGAYSRDAKQKETPERGIVPNGVEPHTFKACIASLNHEYASGRQQDAHEFLLFLLQQVEAIAGLDPQPEKAFEFEMRQAIIAQTPDRPRAKFMYTPETVLSIGVAGETPLNKAEVEAFEKRKASGEKIPDEETVRPRYALESLISHITQPQELKGLKFGGQEVVANSVTSITTFPDVLTLHVKKFGLKPDWSPYKMDIEIEVPDQLDVEAIFSDNEVLRDVSAMSFLPEPVVEQSSLDSLIGMGFPREHCIKALYNTASSGRRNLEVAINWLMEHSADADIDSPLPEPVQIVHGRQNSVSNGAKRLRLASVSDDLIEQVVAMGFTPSQAKNALVKNNGSVERAIEYIFSNPDEVRLEDFKYVFFFKSI